MDPDKHVTIAVIGAGGTIGRSLVALYSMHLPAGSTIVAYDVTPDLQDRLTAYLHRPLPPPAERQQAALRVVSSLREAVSGADIVQEAGPESEEWKVGLWAEVEMHANPDALFWSTTSGIPASRQGVRMREDGRRRLCVVHLFNPPHVLPLVEVVPGPETDAKVVMRSTVRFWRERIGRDPIVIKQEIPGFVAGRLMWVVLREAISLVDRGVVSVEEVDRAIEMTMGVRWAWQGVFKSFHAGGGEKGLKGLMDNVGGTVQRVWDGAGRVGFGDGTGWEERVFGEVDTVYGTVDEEWLKKRDEVNQGVLQVVRRAKEEDDDPAEDTRHEK